MSLSPHTRIWFCSLFFYSFFFFFYSIFSCAEYATPLQPIRLAILHISPVSFVSLFHLLRHCCGPYCCRCYICCILSFWLSVMSCFMSVLLIVTFFFIFNRFLRICFCSCFNNSSKYNDRFRPAVQRFYCKTKKKRWRRARWIVRASPNLGLTE